METVKKLQKNFIEVTVIPAYADHTLIDFFCRQLNFLQKEFVLTVGKICAAIILIWYSAI
jgi:hypothetical protein